MRVDVFLQEIGSIEEIILKNNARKEDYYKSIQERKNNQNNQSQSQSANNNNNNNNKYSVENIIKEKTKTSENNLKNRMAAIKMREELEGIAQESSTNVPNETRNSPNANNPDFQMGFLKN